MKASNVSATNGDHRPAAGNIFAAVRFPGDSPGRSAHQLWCHPCDEAQSGHHTVIATGPVRPLGPCEGSIACVRLADAW